MKLDEADEAHADPTPTIEPLNLESIFDLYGMAGFLVRRAKQKSTALFTEACNAQNITPPQYAVLRILMALPGLDQGELAEYAGLDEATIGGIVDRLHKRDLVDRRRSGRRRIAFLSERGRELLSMLEPAVAKAQSKLLSPLTGREQRQLKRLLSKMTGTANEYHRPRRARRRSRLETSSVPLHADRSVK